MNLIQYLTQLLQPKYDDQKIEEITNDTKVSIRWEIEDHYKKEYAGDIDPTFGQDLDLFDPGEELTIVDPESEDVWVKAIWDHRPKLYGTGEFLLSIQPNASQSEVVRVVGTRNMRYES